MRASMRIRPETTRPQFYWQPRFVKFQALLLALTIALSVATSRLRADTGTCGGANVTVPFMDVTGNQFFCTIAAAYFAGLTSGTSAITYSPDNVVTRDQMSAFITRTLDQSLRRGSRRAALNQWWTHQGSIGGTGVSKSPADIVCDGTDLWVACEGGINFPASVFRLKSSDSSFVAGYELPARTLIVAGDAIYVAGGSTLSYIDRAGIHTVGTGFTGNLQCLAFDGKYIWTGSSAGVVGGVVGKVLVTDNSVTTANSGFGTLSGMLYDGNNVWVTEQTPSGNGYIRRLDSDGTVNRTISTGSGAGRPVFDGTNIWVPNQGDSTVTIIRATTGAVLAQLSGNGLNGPVAAAFDGERIMVTNFNGGTVSLWKAVDLTPLGSFDAGTSRPFGICSDGVSFWVTASNSSFIRRL